MLSKNQIRRLHALTQKKYRYQEGVFLAEGPKLVEELLPAFACEEFYYTADYTGKLPPSAQEISRTELRAASRLEAPQQVMAVFRMRTVPLRMDMLRQKWVLALDQVQDAGNLGTIVRIADWFGIDQVLCSRGTVDVYSPKTVQATMGALARVQVHTVDLPQFLRQVQQYAPDLSLCATSPIGDNLYAASFPTAGILVLGNEGNGISGEVMSLCTQRVRIPNYPEGRPCSESLNVAVAAAVLCAELRRGQR